MFTATAAGPRGFPFMPLLRPDPRLRSQLPDLVTLAHLSRPVLHLSSQFCEVPEILPINFFFALKKKKLRGENTFTFWFPVYPTVIPFPQVTLILFSEDKLLILELF